MTQFEVDQALRRIIKEMGEIDNGTVDPRWRVLARSVAPLSLVVADQEARLRAATGAK